MPAGYSGTPLVKKLGIKSGMKIRLLHAPDGYLAETLGELPEGVRVLKARGKEVDVLHLFSTERRLVEAKLEGLKREMATDGCLWLSWPKKASGVETDLDGNVVRELGLEAGLVDVKVCAVDETWSGLKFVYRVEDR